MTPYVAGLFQESMATVGFFCLKGCCRWLTNRPFTDHWFTEEEAQELMDKQVRQLRALTAGVCGSGNR